MTRANCDVFDRLAEVSSPMGSEKFHLVKRSAVLALDEPCSKEPSAAVPLMMCIGVAIYTTTTQLLRRDHSSIASQIRASPLKSLALLTLSQSQVNFRVSLSQLPSYHARLWPASAQASGPRKASVDSAPYKHNTSSKPDDTPPTVASRAIPRSSASLRRVRFAATMIGSQAPMDLQWSCP